MEKNKRNITTEWLKEKGWRQTFTGDYCKCINNAWCEMEYTDYECDFLLKKEIARL